MRFITITLAASTLIGCSSPNPAADASVPDASASACTDLDEPSCEAAAGCRSIRGAPAEEVCIDDYSDWAMLWAGCTGADLGCDDLETCAADPATGTRYFFPDSCVPDAWVPCSCSVPAACENGGEKAALGQICVRGRTGVAGESIEVGSRVVVTATPRGCHGSGCVRIYDRVCEVDGSGPAFTVTSLICLGPSGADACQPDCSGAGYATCHTQTLAAGTYTVSAGGLTVTFDVPSEIPFGGLCDGDPLGRLTRDRPASGRSAR